MVADSPRGPGVHVCHVISGDLWAGAAVQVYHTVSDLRRRNVEVSVAVFNDGVLSVAWMPRASPGGCSTRSASPLSGSRGAWLDSSGKPTPGVCTSTRTRSIS